MTTIGEQFKNREQVMMKFSDAPFTGSAVLNPGWAEPTYDDFFMRMEDTPVLVNQSTVIPMSSLQHDLDDLTLTVEFDAQRNMSSGRPSTSTGLTANETVPQFSRKQLLAQPLQAKTIITENWLDENIEGQRFLDKYLGRLGEAMGPAFERWALFAKKGSSTVSGEGTGYALADGILAQLETIATDSTANKGIYDLIATNKILEGIVNAILAYIDQEGDIMGATLLLPPTIYARLMAEIASNEKTEFDRLILQEANMTKIMGIEIKQDNILRTTRNGYGTMKFNSTTKAYDPTNGSNVTGITWGILTKATNIIFGMMRNIETRNQYDIDILGYKVAGLCKGDVKVHWDQDTIALPFYTPSS